MNFALSYAHLKWWAWFILTKAFLGVIYISVMADGLRTLIPALGQKLYQLPLLGELKHYEGTHRLDLAPFMAFLIAIAVFYLWERILSFWLGAEYDDGPHWDSEKEGELVLKLGYVLLGADILLFYSAMTAAGWGESVFSFSALLATISYIGVMIFVSYVSIRLNRDITILKKEKVHHVQNSVDSRSGNVHRLRPAATAD